MTVGELLARVTSRELSEWQAYYKMEPFGQQNDWLRSGTVAATIANVNRDAKKRPRPYESQDFIPQFIEEETEDKSWQQIQDKVKRVLNLKEK